MFFFTFNTAVIMAVWAGQNFNGQNCLIAFFLLSDESDGLQILLGFVKGLDTIHSLGFDLSPRLKFHHPNPVDEYDGYANILTVPVFMSDYDLF